jgi:hypothetical protein
MLDIFKRQVNKKVKDYASVSSQEEVSGIVIPVITLEKYPEIVNRGAELVQKLGKKIAEQQNKSLGEVLENLEPKDLLQYIPLIIKIAAEEFFGLAAFVLEVDVEQIKKIGMVDLIRIIKKLNEINQFAEVQQDVQNFMKALAKTFNLKTKETEKE